MPTFFHIKASRTLTSLEHLPIDSFPLLIKPRNLHIHETHQPMSTLPLIIHLPAQPRPALQVGKLDHIFLPTFRPRITDEDLMGVFFPRCRVTPDGGFISFPFDVVIDSTDLTALYHAFVHVSFWVPGFLVNALLRVVLGAVGDFFDVSKRKFGAWEGAAVGVLWVHGGDDVLFGIRELGDM
jgi:hypothetical protein